MDNKKYGEIQDKVVEFVNSIMSEVGEERMADLAIDISIQAANYGSNTAIEAMGILEIAKITYLKRWEEIMNEEMIEEEIKKEKKVKNKLKIVK